MNKQSRVYPLYKLAVFKKLSRQNFGTNLHLWSAFPESESDGHDDYTSISDPVQLVGQNIQEILVDETDEK